MVELKPHEVILVEVIPACDFCDHDNAGTPGPYDFKTMGGSWAHGCYEHWRYHAAYGTLGVGKGQLWVTQEQLDAG